MQGPFPKTASMSLVSRRSLLTGSAVLGLGLVQNGSRAAAAQFDQTQIKVIWESTGSADKPLVAPEGIALAGDGSVWVANTKRDEILIIGPDGHFVEAWGGPGKKPGQFRFRGPRGSFLGDIDFDADGNIYVFDAFNHRIQKFDSERTFLLEFAGDGTADGAFEEPMGSVDAVGKQIFVADPESNRVRVFDLDGHFLWEWGTQGIEDGQFFWPIGVAIGKDGSIYVAEVKGKRIQKFDADRAFLSRVASTGEEPGQVQDVYYVAVDANDNLYVSDAINRRLQIFTPQGSFIGLIDTVPGIGKFGFPTGIAVDADGFLYVADGFEHRLLKLELPSWT